MTEAKQNKTKNSSLVFYWTVVSLFGMIIELIKMWIDSQCGLIQMSCSRTAIFGWYWAFWIVFGFGLLVAQIYYSYISKDKKEVS